MKNKIFILLIFFSSGVFSQADTWRGLKIEKESRCSPYNRSQDYAYPQAIENKIIESLGNKIYSPYSGEFFKSKEQTDIDHIVSLAEAHDSGLCSADKKTKSKFAKDIKNLTLTSPEINRDKKSGLDASGWTPEKNKCWFANKVIEVKRAYKLTIDSAELIALEKVISQCNSFDMVFIESKKENKKQNKIANSDNPKVKKSKSGICHSKETSSYYSRLKNFMPYESLELCLSSGGRCPKKDFGCQKATSNKQSPYDIKQKTYTLNNYYSGIAIPQ